jgi:predicted RNA-binding protein with PUA-like domain
MLVDISFVQKLKRPVTATEMKKDPILKNMTLWRIPRLSIHSLEEKDYKHIVGLADKGSLF